MSLKYLLLGILLGLLGSSCTTSAPQTVWPTPRPLGAEIPTYRPPTTPSHSVVTPQAIAESTDILRLSQAQALALMHNPELAAFTWEVRAKEARTLQAGLAPNPEIGVEFENFAGTGNLQGIDGAEVTVALSQVIELAGKRQKRTRVAALERDLSAWDYEATRLDVLTRVTQAFVDVLSAQERLAVDTELVRLAEQVLQGAEARVKAGKVPPIETTRARVALSTSRMALGRTQRALTAAKARLVAIWGGTHPAFEKAVGDLESLRAIPSAEALAERIEQNPDLARWATVMAQRQAAITLEEAKRIPDPTLGGGFRYFNETQDQAFLFLVSMPLPIFDRNQGNLLETRYQSAKAEAERRMAAVGVRSALAESYAELSAAFAEARTLRDEILPGAERAFETASTGHRQGKFQFLDVLDAQRTLVEVRGQYIEVLATYHRAVAALERLIGEPLNALTQSSSQP
jgi:cobalt-zinc-cadmium efflux system outer membrane protein